jgi:hypothetical protein
MKKLSLLVIGILLITKCYSQSDSIEKKTFWIRTYFENGITFIQNDMLKAAYKSNTMYNWGFGLRIGNPNKNVLLPYVLFSTSALTNREKGVNDENMDSTLKINELAFGFHIAIKRFNSNLLRAKIGYIHSIISDDVFDNSDKANGFQIGLGYEANVFKNSRIYIDYSYDLNKLTLASYRDYDVSKLTVGFIF